jgi:hypothetical protein
VFAERLLPQFALATIMVVVCVVIHGLGLFGITAAVRHERTAERLQRMSPLSRHGALFTLVTVFAIITLHGIEIWLFALLYLAIGAASQFEAALYLSTISYSTVGYSDAEVSNQWRLLAAFESILGIILLGWSTAFFFRTLGRMDAH